MANAHFLFAQTVKVSIGEHIIVFLFDHDLLSLKNNSFDLLLKKGTAKMTS